MKIHAREPHELGEGNEEPCFIKDRENGNRSEKNSDRQWGKKEKSKLHSPGTMDGKGGPSAHGVWAQQEVTEKNRQAGKSGNKKEHQPYTTGRGGGSENESTKERLDLTKGERGKRNSLSRHRGYSEKRERKTLKSSARLAAKRVWVKVGVRKGENAQRKRRYPAWGGFKQ